MHLFVDLKDALLVDMLHFLQGLNVLLEQIKFWFVVDQPFPDEFAKVLAKPIFADEDIDAIFDLLVAYAVGLGIIFEVQAIKLSDLPEVVFRAKRVALILIADKLHPYQFNVVFEFVLIELKVNFLLPISQLKFGLLYLFLHICYICFDFVIFLLEINDAHREFAFCLVLILVRLNEFLMILFLSNAFLCIKSRRVYLFPKHQYLILELFYRLSLVCQLLFAFSKLL